MVAGSSHLVFRCDGFGSSVSRTTAPGRIGGEWYSRGQSMEGGLSSLGQVRSRGCPSVEGRGMLSRPMRCRGLGVASCGACCARRSVWFCVAV